MQASLTIVLSAVGMQCAACFKMCTDKLGKLMLLCMCTVCEKCSFYYQVFTNSATVAVLLLTSFILLLKTLLYRTVSLAQTSVVTTKLISTNEIPVCHTLQCVKPK